MTAKKAKNAKGKTPAKSNPVARDTLFISHATPKDNAFATWLASRLSMAGYEVWCDKQKLLGGEDFWKDIERAIRNRAVKFVLVMSEYAFNDEGELRDGIAKEVGLANTIKKQVKDDYFIIPMRIDDTEYSDFAIDFHRLNGIDCGKNWASGLSTLLKVLERDGVPCDTAKVQPSLQAWREVHQHHARAIINKEERLHSNWLSISNTPKTLYFYEILREIRSSEPRAIASDCPLPCVEHGRLLAAFAGHAELQSALGENIPVKLRGQLKTQKFLEGKTGDILGILPRDARNKLSSLLRQGWDNLMREKGLAEYEMANDVLAWWFTDEVVEDNLLRYVDFNGKSRRRAVIGTRGKKEAPDGSEVPRYYWHLGFTGRPIISDNGSVIAIRPRLIVTEDKETPLASKTRLNSVRRSITTMWFNDKWRGLVLGFANWLADNQKDIQIPMAAKSFVSLRAEPVSFISEVGINSDPVSESISDETSEADEREEINKRLSDPAFRNPDNEDGEE